MSKITSVTTQISVHILVMASLRSVGHSQTSTYAMWVTVYLEKSLYVAILLAKVAIESVFPQVCIALRIFI